VLLVALRHSTRAPARRRARQRAARPELGDCRAAVGHGATLGLSAPCRRRSPSPPIAAAVDLAGVLLVELGDRCADVTPPRRGPSSARSAPRRHRSPPRVDLAGVLLLELGDRGPRARRDLHYVAADRRRGRARRRLAPSPPPIAGVRRALLVTAELSSLASCPPRVITSVHRAPTDRRSPPRSSSPSTRSWLSSTTAVLISAAARPELGADLELGAGCTTSPPIAAAAKLAGVVRRDVSRVSG